MRGERGFISVILTAGILLLVALSGLAAAQTGGGYDLTWNTVDGGGITFGEGGGYALGGTAGQMDAGLLSGGPFTLAGGFWGRSMAGMPAGFRVYLPLVLKVHP
jgi:hypothetical protein